jgi:hypothetical protein
LNSFKDSNCDRLWFRSERSPARRHCTANLWNMQAVGASTDIIVAVTYSDYLCKGVL